MGLVGAVSQGGNSDILGGEQIANKITKLVSDRTMAGQDHQDVVGGGTPSASPASLSPDWASTESLVLLRRLLKVSAQAPPAVARRAGLTHNELSTLELLVERPIGPGDIARHLSVTSAATSGIVDRLAERGHLRRAPHPHDGRRTELQITESGRAEVLGHLMPMFVALAELDGSLDDHERAAVESYLRGAVDAVSRLL